MYDLYKQGKLPYEKLREFIHSTSDMSKLPERVTPKKDTSKSTALAVKGLI